MHRPDERASRSSASTGLAFPYMSRFAGSKFDPDIRVADVLDHAQHSHRRRLPGLEAEILAKGLAEAGELPEG